MKKKQLLLIIITFWGWAFYSCVPQSEIIQYCPEQLPVKGNFLENNLLLGYVSEGNVQWKILNLNNLQERDFYTLNKANQGLLLSISDSQTDSVAYNIKISPSGKWIAYTLYTSFSGYYLETRDRTFSQFVPKTDYRIVYTSFQGEQNWYLIQEEFPPSSPPKTLIYPFSPNEEEKMEALLSPIQLSDEDIATSWIAFSGTKDVPTLVVQSYDGSEVLSYPDWDNEWQVLQGWFDENTIMLASYYWQLDNNRNPYNSRQDAVILFNPFTGEKNISGTQYSDIALGGQRFVSWPSRVSYSPRRNYLVYSAGEHPNSHFAIWDIVANSLVVETSQLEQISFSRPVWINETTFIYVARDKESNVENLFSFNVKGVTEQLTHLEDFFSSPEILSSHLDLSPNKEILAFWITSKSYNGTPQNRLLFLDMENLKVYDFCVSYIGDMHTPNRYISQTWLSKQNYYAVSSFENGKENILIVDVNSHKLYSIPVPFNTVLIGEIYQ